MLVQPLMVILFNHKNITNKGEKKMELQEKLALIEEVLDVEEGSLKPETELADVDEWDSIAALSLIVMLDEKFEKTVSGAQIKALETVNDILAFMV